MSFEGHGFQKTNVKLISLWTPLFAFIPELLFFPAAFPYCILIWLVSYIFLNKCRGWPTSDWTASCQLTKTSLWGPISNCFCAYWGTHIRDLEMTDLVSPYITWALTHPAWCQWSQHFGTYLTDGFSILRPQPHRESCEYGARIRTRTRHRIITT